MLNVGAPVYIGGPKGQSRRAAGGDVAAPADVKLVVADAERTQGVSDTGAGRRRRARDNCGCAADRHVVGIDRRVRSQVQCTAIDATAAPGMPRAAGLG